RARAPAAVARGLSHAVHGQRRLPRRPGAEDLDHPAPGQAADAEREVERERAGGNGGDADVAVLPQPHDRALAELLLDLADGHLEGVVAFHDGTLLVCDVRAVGGNAVGSNLRRGCDNYLWCLGHRVRLMPPRTRMTRL